MSTSMIQTLSQHPSLEGMVMVQQLLGINNLSLPQHAVLEPHSVRHINQQLEQLQGATQRTVTAQIVEAIAFGQAILALDPIVRSSFKSSDAMTALCTWLQYTGVDNETVQRMRRRQWTYRSLWDTQEDCSWWMKHIADSALKIKSMSHLLVLVQLREQIIGVHGDGDAKRQFWLRALSQSPGSANHLSQWIDQTCQY